MGLPVRAGPMNYRSISLVTLFSFVNVLMTSVNQVILASLFGAGTSMDAFIACGAVPLVILNLAIGDLSYVLVPLLLRYKDDRERGLVINSCFSVIVLLALVVSTVGVVAHRPILSFTTSQLAPQTFEMAASLASSMWIIMGLTIIGSFLTGLHYHHHSFTVPSSTLAFPYLGMIVGGVVGAGMIGIQAVVLGWLAGMLLRDLVLYRALGSQAPKLSVGIVHPAVRMLLSRLVPLGASLLPFAALPLVDVFWASRLPTGSISFLGYGTRIVIAMTSLVVQGVSVVLFPQLSADAASDDLAGLRLKISRGIELVFGLIVPLACLVFLVRVPLVTLGLQRGRFTAESTLGVTSIVPFFLFGSIWMALMNIVSRAFYALQEYTVPARSGVVALCAYAILSGVLVGRYSYYGIGVSYVCFWVCLFFVQTVELGRRIGTLADAKLLLYIVKVMVAGGFSLLAVGLLGRYLWTVRGAGALLNAVWFLPVFYLFATYVCRLRLYESLIRQIHGRWLVSGGLAKGQ